MSPRNLSRMTAEGIQSPPPPFTLEQLRDLAAEYGIPDARTLPERELMAAIRAEQAERLTARGLGDLLL